jgi:hypothetical protein
MFFDPYFVQTFYESIRDVFSMSQGKAEDTEKNGYPPWYDHPFDARVRFQGGPDRAYFLEGSREGTISVTTLIATLFPPFDADEAILAMVNGRNWNASHRWKAYDGRWDDLKARWEADNAEARRRGNAVHAYLQAFFESVLRREDPFSVPRPPPEDFRWSQLAEFLLHHRHLTPFRFEWVICDPDSGICGTVDALFLREDGDFELYDWKTYGEIEEEDEEECPRRRRRRRGNLFSVAAHLPDVNTVHAAIQINGYNKILSKYELPGGGKVIKLGVVVFHPSNPSYVKLEFPISDDIVGPLFAQRAAQFARLRNESSENVH